MKYFRLLLALSFLVTYINPALSQEIPPAQKAMAIQELQSRGITEAEFKARMKQKGVDIDNLKPEQLPGLEPIIREAVAELEREKQQKTRSTAPPGRSQDTAPYPIELTPQAAEAVQKSATEIGKAVEKGATLEEAISEKAADITKQELPSSLIYGQDIFRKQRIQLYKTVTDVKPPDSYVLGVGDEIAVSIWGISQADFVYEINEQGYITPAGKPRIFLKGVTYGQAKKMIQSRLSQFYVFQPEQFSVSIYTARTITVNIFGEVFNFGSFTLSAVNTAFNALVAAGGPSDIGTLRNIQLIRNNRTIKVDVYEFLFDPKVQYNFFLENNDILFVPVAERIVNIRGAIKRPFSYELIKGENLMKLLEFAGGLNVDAYKKSIQIQRISGNENILLDINLQELLDNKKDFDLKNGDIITIRSIPDRLDNFAEIAGAVDFPGKYELTPGMKISDLVSKGHLQRETRTDLAFLLRTKPDSTISLFKLNLDKVLAQPGNAADLELEPKDQLILYASSIFVDKMTISVEGAVRSPIQHPFDSETSLRVQDAILLAGGLKPTAAQFGFIKRSDVTNPKMITYLRVDLFSAISNANSPENIPLQPLDVLQVMDKGNFTDEYAIEVDGAVRNPGKFQYADNLTVQAVLTMAGGLKLEAASNRIEIYRLHITTNQPTQTIVATLQVDENLAVTGDANFRLQPFDKIVVRTVPDFKLQQTVTLSGEVKYPGVYALLFKNEKLNSIIQRAGGLTLEAFPEGASMLRTEDNIGPVVTQLDEALRNPNSKYNYVLKNGDSIYIPKSQDLVTLQLGSTLASRLYPERIEAAGKINVAYSNGKRAGWYLREFAGGIDRPNRARKKLISVEHPNGEIKRTANLLAFKITPKVRKGSVVSVGTKPEKPEQEKQVKEKEPIDVERLVTSFLSLATTALTVLVLSKQL